MVLKVIEDPKLPRDGAKRRCGRTSPPVPFINAKGKEDSVLLSCLRALRHGTNVKHVAATVSDKGTTTWLEWSDEDLKDASVEEDL